MVLNQCYLFSKYFTEKRQQKKNRISSQTLEPVLIPLQKFVPSLNDVPQPRHDVQTVPHGLVDNQVYAAFADFKLINSKYMVTELTYLCVSLFSSFIRKFRFCEHF